MKKICIVAILADETKFIDEWILYHRHIGIDHFFLYDDDPSLPLATYLKPHANYVTIVPWYNRHQTIAGRNRQTKAYSHAVREFAYNFEWVNFLDGDEFIVLRQHQYIGDFLEGFTNYTSIALNWHVFGHNGYYEDPEGLVISSLIRRKAEPSSNIKSITRPQYIKDISSAHFCRELNGKRADANRRPYSDLLYDGKTKIAHINHYQCRSFLQWMNRTNRGCVTIESPNLISAGEEWRINQRECLRKFVTSIAFDKNEFVDEYLVKYASAIYPDIEKLTQLRK